MNVSMHELMPVVRDALGRGQRVQMTATGNSMLPFIRDGDAVELDPMQALPRAGEIVLAHCYTGPYVLHRVVRVEGDEFFMRGDSQRNREGPFTLSDVLGRVTVIRRGRQAMAVNRGFWRCAGVVWMSCAPISFYLLWLTIRVRGNSQRFMQRFPLFRRSP